MRLFYSQHLQAYHRDKLFINFDEEEKKTERGAEKKKIKSDQNNNTWRDEYSVCFFEVTYELNCTVCVKKYTIENFIILLLLLE